MSRRRGRFVAFPEDMYDRLVDAGLSDGAALLVWGAYVASSRGTLDGRVPLVRLRRDPHWSPEHEAELVAAGFLQLDSGFALLAEYLAVNYSREEILSRSQTNSENRAAGWHPEEPAKRESDGEREINSEQSRATHSTSRNTAGTTTRNTTGIDGELSETRSDAGSIVPEETPTNKGGNGTAVPGDSPTKRAMRERLASVAAVGVHVA